MKVIPIIKDRYLFMINTFHLPFILFPRFRDSLINFFSLHLSDRFPIFIIHIDPMNIIFLYSFFSFIAHFFILLFEFLIVPLVSLKHNFKLNLFLITYYFSLFLNIFISKHLLYFL